ncbi:FkbM family methyltransferase [Pararhodonellum marinum]|uniref:FkbM family methyltransferase n=1 Tax=Pararhodonellum marinum TaxID=2755358 RepID=UPI001890534D|nr:FkbM family methyltransferase [Pararhodonellum marinum]
MSFFSFKAKQKPIPNAKEDELNRIRSMAFEESGVAVGIFDKPFQFHHAASFVNTYKEIFQDEIYKFDPLVTSGGLILDCGANMGLSVLYFALNYPDHKILAFEPEAEIFEVLKGNVMAFDLKNVTLYKKAVWIEESELVFHSDGGMGGRIHTIYKNSPAEVTKVKTIELKKLLNEKVDFLKIDIEGAEYEVLKDCKNELSKVKHLFFEYHNDVFKVQTLHELLQMVVEEGFTYHLKESSARMKPFIDKDLICERYDMAITVFCSKKD